MADSKITGLTATTTLLTTDILPVVTDPAGTPVTKKITLENLWTALVTAYKGIGSEIVTGTDDAKFVTAKAIKDANILSQAWTSVTPGITNATLGTGGVSTAKYTRVGKLMKVQGSITFGTSMAVSGGILIGVPVTTVSPTAAGYEVIGTCSMRDTGTALFKGSVIWNSTSNVGLQFEFVNGTNIGFSGTSATAPFTWAATDAIYYEYTVEVA